MPDDKSGTRKRREARQLIDASSVGLVFPIAIALGFGWGYGMDHLFGTSWLRFLFAGFGAVAGFINLFRVAGENDGNDTDGPAAGSSP